MYQVSAPPNLNRREVLREMLAEGVQPYRERFEVSHACLGNVPAIEGQALSVAGRILSIRKFGGRAFATLGDITGQIQISLRADRLKEEDWRLFRRYSRAGDFIGVTGVTFRTDSGELTVEADAMTILSVALRPLPEKWHGLNDAETRYRKRYLDLIANQSSRDVLLARSRLTWALRSFLHREEFIEVETRVLHTTNGGALARPFISHHNALDLEVTLRIAPELDLKRAIAAGYPRVFEIADCFRNEGISADHLQEFRMLEFYASCWSFRDHMEFSRRLLQTVLFETFGRLTFEHPAPEGGPVRAWDFSRDWPTVSYRRAILDACGVDIDRCRDVEALRQACANVGVELEETGRQAGNLGRMVDALYKRVARPRLQQPVFLVGHPISTSPLARRSDHNPNQADRFQLVVGGVELMNGYSELINPVDQRQRLESQAAYKGLGDDEAMDHDEDFLVCMEHGMPPIAGCGLGIDRLLKVVLGLPNIRETVLFPLMRPADARRVGDALD
jgi:lysyl-tRNA synthetase class 2